MILAAVSVAVIERRFPEAAVWSLAAAGLAAIGLIHSYAFTPADTAVSLTPAWPWAAGYAVMAALFLGARWLTVEGGAEQLRPEGRAEDP